MVALPKLRAPRFDRKSFGLSSYVHYDHYNPGNADSTHGRKSLTNLDYSPLRRVTWASFYMAILVSMGGFSKTPTWWAELIFTDAIQSLATTLGKLQ